MSMIDFQLGDVGGVFTSLREAITGDKIKDPLEMAKVDLQLQQLEQAARDGQIAVNKIEAASDSLFVAGWRPFIGWVSGIAIAYAFIGQPILEWVVAINEMEITTPTIESDRLFELVIAMLGMAGLRTYEKKQKVSREK